MPGLCGGNWGVTLRNVYRLLFNQAFSGSGIQRNGLDRWRHVKRKVQKAGLTMGLATSIGEEAEVDAAMWCGGAL